MNSQMIASPIRIGKKVAPNRIVTQPMECNDADSSGNPTDLTFQRYRRIAEGGAGVINFESLTITLESRARKNQLLITEENAKKLERLIREMRAVNHESLILFQLNHSGRLSEKAFSKVVSVYPTGDPTVHVLTEKEVEAIASSFVKAAVISKQVGADGIDFKHCHGYIGAEMVRPANTRQDRFGGSFENRTRFTRETARQMRTALDDESFLIGVRFSIYDGIAGGFGTSGPEEVIEDLGEPIAFVTMLEEIGMDYINVSAGIAGSEITQPSKKYPEGVYRHFGWTKAVKKTVEIPVIGSGYSYLRDGKNNLQEPERSKKSFLYWAEKNLKDGNVDLVGIGRQSLADPLFPRKILSGETQSIDYCTTCDRCLALMLAQKEVGCAIHNAYYRDLYRRIKKEAQS
ncbi:MAG: 2,4-dienoyl-CoA reductase [Proteobacteria bacterium]|nr:2,4-dienoyl-CoA reductase [Pseudomonadota bacterium]NIS72550.1 2,4-dienoyl-CoA reductase [Pseudomonadota bacterium]